MKAAAKLHARRQGQTGPLESAYVRRSISTTYYTLFHFILDQTAILLVGSHNDLRQRRRLFIRTLSRGGPTTAFTKLKGSMIDASVADPFRLPEMAAGPVATPQFVQQIATVYGDAKSKREDADYDLNKPLSEADARQLHRRVKRAIAAWNAANTAADRDVKHAVALLLSLNGKLKG